MTTPPHAMGNLYLVRHGQASLGADDYDQLSELGHRQTVRLGAYFAQQGLTFDGLITGTLKRHRQTLAGILEGLGPQAARAAGEPLAWPGLNEYDSAAVIAAVHPQPLGKPNTPEAYRHHFRVLREGLTQWAAGQVNPRGMPTYEAFVAGVTGALDHVRAHHAGRNVLIVSSGGPIATAVGQVLQTPPSSSIELNLRMRNTSITHFAFTPKRCMLVSYNGIPHLDDPTYREWVTYA